MKKLQRNKDYVDLSTLPYLRVDLKYASKNNFMGFDMYGKFRKAFLHKDAATKLRKAIAFLQREKPGWSFVVWDALRPRSVQWIMWDKVKDTPRRKYVANAAIGSAHNYGMAVDIGLLDEKGREVDMGTGYDSFTALAEPRKEKAFLRSGELTKERYENRLVLRRAMTKAGFLQLSHEWWHYNALPEKGIREKYRIVE